MTTPTRTVVRPGRQVAGTRRLVAAIARDLRQLYGRNGRLDEAGAERHLRFIVAQARKDAAKPEGRNLPPGMSAGIEPARTPGARRTMRTGLIARVRSQIVKGSYESEERVEAALCGLADELGV